MLLVNWRLRAAAWDRRRTDTAGSDGRAGVPGPVVVGGVGGSGTRVVEEMLRLLGVYTGGDLNGAGDNRWFTLLCKLPRWDLDPPRVDGDIVRALGTLERTMTGRLDIPGDDGDVIREAYARARHWWRSDRLRDDRPPRWLRARVRTLLRARRGAQTAAPLWGWKEPNSHLMIRHLELHFGERLRYVHVIRNGLHMAQSRNQLQVRRWGSHFGLPDEGPVPTPAASLDYWIRANEAAIKAGKALPPGAFLEVSYDELCAHPESEVDRFVRFLGLQPTDAVRQEMARIPRAVTLRTDCDSAQVYGGDRLARVEALGFPLANS